MGAHDRLMHGVTAPAVYHVDVGTVGDKEVEDLEKERERECVCVCV
jgi:hypothetical protein